MLRLTRRHQLGLAAAAVTALVVAATAAGASGPTVVLGLTGTHAKKRQICPKESHPNLLPASQVRRNVALTLAGTVRPAPTRAAWHATVVVKRCIGGDYKQVWEGRAVGTRTGAFRASYTPRLRGLYVARAKYGKQPSVDSNKLYFSAN